MSRPVAQHRLFAVRGALRVGVPVGAGRDRLVAALALDEREARRDSGARGGVALAVRRELGLPIRWIGTGERATDLVPFAAEAYVDGLLGAPANP
jgi:fused signal recognition particle receptor